MDKLSQLALEMISYEKGDPKRSQHFIKVHSLCRLIAIGENMPEDELFTLEAAALVHDIGIRPAMEKYGYQNGKLQEELGPEKAEEMLTRLGFDKAVVERACWLVGHHHTYTNVDSLDHRILLEADWLVNNYEYSQQNRDIYAPYELIFKTETGRKIFRDMF